MFEKLLTNAEAAVLGAFKFYGPVINRFVQLYQRLFLPQEPILGEDEGFALQVGNQTLMQFLPAGSERLVCPAKVFAALVKSS
jgi:hypothetical protein